MKAEEKSGWIKHLDFIVIDLLSLVAAFVAAYFWKFGDFGFAATETWRSLLAILLLLHLVLNILREPYRGIFRRRYYEDVKKYLLLAVYSFLGACIMFYLFKVGERYSREMLVVMYCLYTALSLLAKFVRKHMVVLKRNGRFSEKLRKMFVVTTRSQAAETSAYIGANDFKEYEIVGYAFASDAGGEGELPHTHEPMASAADAANGNKEYAGLPVVPLSGLSNYVIRKNIDDVFVGVDPGLIAPSAYRAMMDNEVAIHLSIEQMVGLQSDSQLVTRVGVYKTLEIAKFSFGMRQTVFFAVKRVFDILFSLVGCAFLLPIALVVKLCYLLGGDTAPIFYRQRRVGLCGEVFELLKFRSMVSNADEVLRDLLKDPRYRAEWEENQKFEDDPRITPIGRVLRRTSLDEFPQFVNVLKGDMSVVGPRPLVEGELEAHDGRSLYNKVKPGITGWWGCNGRSNIDYRERLELEYHYVKHCSLYLDALCVFRTIGAVLKKEGAQ